MYWLATKTLKGEETAMEIKRQNCVIQEETVVSLDRQNARGRGR